MAGVMHIGAGLVGLKSEIAHGTRATSEFRYPPELRAHGFVRRFAVPLGLLVTRQDGQTADGNGRKETKQMEGWKEGWKDGRMQEQKERLQDGSLVQPLRSRVPRRGRRISGSIETKST